MNDDGMATDTKITHLFSYQNLYVGALIIYFQGFRYT